MKWFNLINLKLVTAGPRRLELNSAKTTEHLYSVPLQKAIGGSKASELNKEIPKLTSAKTLSKNSLIYIFISGHEFEYLIQYEIWLVTANTASRFLRVSFSAFPRSRVKALGTSLQSLTVRFFRLFVFVVI